MFYYSLEIRGFEPLTYGLQSRRSSQLSYIPLQQTSNIKKEGKEEVISTGFVYNLQSILNLPFSKKGGDPAAPSGTATLLRLHPPHQAYLRHRPPLRVRRATSGTPTSDGVTGGVYKARERIHRAVLMRDY